ncbi:MAG TPA: ABC transporter ATP-binding protein [Candidatus Aenigmarchaeota archaeon]|nr:ABC transporter ATP-binding protein [Candidatus Aenigmarchaeota archaeon]
MKIVIECKNVWKIYNPYTPAEVKALRGVNLSVKRGEFIAIMGSSGSGKSTLLHCIGCLDTPTRGKILIEGVDVSKLDEKELALLRRYKIGFVFQFFNLISNLTALQNVELPMVFAGVSQNKRRERAIELLKMVGLGKRLNHKPNELSGGEQQRVAIARALANNPSIILADEPTGNLDSRSGEEVMNIFVELNKNEGRTILIVTHEPYIAKKAKRIVKIKDGRISGG